jgi:hypothetical protein
MPIHSSRHVKEMNKSDVEETGDEQTAGRGLAYVDAGRDARLIPHNK